MTQSTDNTPMGPGPGLFAGLPEQVTIYEVGPRDGLQNEAQFLPTERKVGMIEDLVAAGVRRVEITSFVNPRWIPALADHAELARALTPRPGVEFSALVPNMRGLDGASRAGVEHVAVFMAASETHNRKNINKSSADALATYAEVIAAARERGMVVRGYVSTAFGCPYEGAVSAQGVLGVCGRLLELGVEELSLGDTIGVGTPRQIEHVLRALEAGGVALDQLAMHLHDTRGTALANLTVALQMGIKTVDAAVGGLGGCPYAPGASGNVATEDVVYMLEGMGVDTGIDLDRLVGISARLGAHLGRDLPSKYLKAHLGHCARSGDTV